MTERANYDVFVRCIDCGYDAIDPSFAMHSKDVIVNSSGVRCRMLVVVVQNECPSCHNLRAVEENRL